MPVVEADPHGVVPDELGRGGGQRSAASLSRRQHVQRILRHRLAFGARLGTRAHPSKQRDGQERHGAVLEGDVQASLPVEMERAWSGLGCVEGIHGPIVAGSVGFRA